MPVAMLDHDHCCTGMTKKQNCKKRYCSGHLLKVKDSKTNEEQSQSYADFFTTVEFCITNMHQKANC